MLECSTGAGGGGCTYLHRAALPGLHSRVLAGAYGRCHRQFELHESAERAHEAEAFALCALCAVGGPLSSSSTANCQPSRQLRAPLVYFYATHATLLRYVRYVRYTLRYTLRYTSCTFIRRRPPLITLRTSFLFCKRYRQCMYQKTTLRMLYTLRDHRD